jgi:hypothetical protein
MRDERLRFAAADRAQTREPPVLEAGVIGRDRLKPAELFADFERQLSASRPFGRHGLMAFGTKSRDKVVGRRLRP